ncbi:MAG TPA: CPBP family intramembrane glutamic endopeptidase [Gemmataceae bacterium]|nr:CPBP family intramembrane glutamic endopeptidase [Gemmataceae bacterium]
MQNDLDPSVADPLIATAIPAHPQKKGQSALAWIMIVLLVLLVLVMHAIAPPGAAFSSGQGLDVRLMQMQARYLIGAKELSGMSGKDVYEQAKGLNGGRVEQRLRFVVLAGELAGPAKALDELNDLGAKLREAGVDETPEQATLEDDLRRLYEDYRAGRLQAPSVSNDEKQQLRTELGWFGDLALAPAGGPDPETRAAILGSAHRTVLALLGYIIGLGLLGLLGFVGLVVFVILLFSGKLQRGVQTGLLHGGVYAETFAVWMALFMALSLGAERLSFGTDLRWLFTGLASLLSLSALFWPVLRGIPWSQVRWEIGLKLGKRPPLEPLIGVATYAMAIPMVALGLLVTFAILLLEGALQGLGGTAENFNQGHFPSHPIVEYVASGDWWARLQILLLASVIAPIVEETMFRGVLYRHLREASARLGLGLSILCSAVCVSFLFAVIHPQGLEAVPILMGLAFTFCLVREWRGSLVPAMIAHGISNGLVLSLLILAMGD